MAVKEHDRIIAEAAKRELAPLGFKRKGRSRLWIADRGYWASIVEFQPSQWSRGSYLNVTPHWLWGLTDGLSFDRPVEGVRSFIEFETADSFAPLAAEQARTAARTSVELEATFSDIRRTAGILIADHEGGRHPGGWPGYHAAVAAGLLGDFEASHRLLETTINSFATWRPDFILGFRELDEATADPSRFHHLIERRISTHRADLGLPDQPMDQVLQLR